MTSIMDSPSPSHDTTSSKESAELLQRLDDLLEQYLHTLDQYQKARQELSSHLSSGFLSLAQANFLNKGRRYGQDYYDERMQAQRRVIIDEDAKEEYAISIATQDVLREDVEDEKTTPKSQDPLRWFGVLLPPAIRSAQATFVSSVEGMPALVTLQQKLRTQEIEIGRARKSLKKLGKV